MDIGEVARRAGVSRSTVSYAITGKRPVSEKTRERIFAIMRDGGYRPNAAAQALRSGSTNTLGMVIPPADHSHLTAGQLVLVGAAVEAAADRDYDVLMSPGGHDREVLGRYLQPELYAIRDLLPSQGRRDLVLLRVRAGLQW